MRRTLLKHRQSCHFYKLDVLQRAWFAVCASVSDNIAYYLKQYCTSSIIDKVKTQNIQQPHITQQNKSYVVVIQNMF